MNARSIFEKIIGSQCYDCQPRFRLTMEEAEIVRSALVEYEAGHKDKFKDQFLSELRMEQEEQS